MTQAIAMRSSSDIEVEITEKDNLILQQMNILDTVQVEKHNLELKLMELSESVRQGKKLLAQMKLKKEILNRDLWVALRRERGQF